MDIMNVPNNRGWVVGLSEGSTKAPYHQPFISHDDWSTYTGQPYLETPCTHLSHGQTRIVTPQTPHCLWLGW